MKKILVFLFVATLGFVAQAQEKKAEIKFVTEEIDYGTVKQGDDGVRVFEFTNTGKAPLVISSAISTCGCTVPSWPKEPIAPGAKGKIEVKYNTANLGAIRKTITITSNATETPTVALRIKGNVVAP
ncbi:DUF1573 domain-containing protein [Capnocytophaga catalasegens]|uniref:DUF1573 domain-containing protein n=1 Tax=Capnocytophaga catalasegens TaxID=1004260 RepID=A0AAV5AZT5_9FLAO|nr:DUF1573 domain-containing protein [Capnocytophaga catalasegens]GIZ15493.1 hypothetical protein RCZ03_14930 [Capnocytophaga catalasegens]GJM51081.1 hypothetical protein RCZ15_20540 [Capnocytophaga catalasegens]GJM52266.1 hypothetical protein RCZ16_05840 [Capnocytophaga catalasegens]